MDRAAKGSGELGSRTVQKALAAVPPRKEDRGACEGGDRTVAGESSGVRRGLRACWRLAEA